MAKKTKAQLNKEFLEKIKTINVGTGSKSDLQDIDCPACGDPLSEHIVVPVIAIPIRRQKPAPKKTEETSFAA